MEKPPAIITDLDGTLVLVPIKYEKRFALMYKPNEPLLEVLRAYQHDHTLLVITCRPLSHYWLATEWLKLYTQLEYRIFMRADHDTRSDWQIKEEIIQELLHKYEIRFAYDDKKDINEMYNRYGIETPVMPKG